jgi:hypothetical protein
MFVERVSFRIPPFWIFRYSLERDFVPYTIKNPISFPEMGFFRSIISCLALKGEGKEAGWSSLLASAGGDG